MYICSTAVSQAALERHKGSGNRPCYARTLDAQSLDELHMPAGCDSHSVRSKPIARGNDHGADYPCVQTVHPSYPERVDGVTSALLQSTTSPTHKGLGAWRVEEATACPCWPKESSLAVGWQPNPCSSLPAGHATPQKRSKAFVSKHTPYISAQQLLMFVNPL